MIAVSDARPNGIQLPECAASGEPRPQRYPTPARLMQERAPAVFEWAARTWNARMSRDGDEPLADGVPEDWAPILREIGETHLEAVAQNAAACSAGQTRHDLKVQGVTYRGIPTSAYRPWCLRQLQERFRELPEAASAEVREMLEDHGCWEPLWRLTDFRCEHDPDGTAPILSRDPHGPRLV